MSLKSLTLVAALAAALGTMPTPAEAATAYLVSCNPATSVTGRLIWVGVYEYGGQRFRRSFGEMCPQSIEVY